MTNDATQEVGKTKINQIQTQPMARNNKNLNRNQQNRNNKPIQRIN